jgi:hypothetical protein
VAGAQLPHGHVWASLNCALRFSAPLLLAPQRSSRSNGGLKWTVDGLGSGLFTNLAK